MITIYTRISNPFKAEFWKYSIKRMLGKYSGPDAVADSLKRGLLELGIPHRFNPLISSQGDIVHVLSGIEALKESIKHKRSGRISKLVAGPNLVILPTEYDRILESPEIDVLLIVSNWTKNFYTSHLPTCANKIHIWPAGVEVPPIPDQAPKNGCVVFKKSVDDNTYKNVIEGLRATGITYTILTYGSFTQAEYFESLRTAKFVVYLQEIESQGIALQEAWVRDVPTLVWNKGSFTFPDGSVVTGDISAPFLVDETGMQFRDGPDFVRVLPDFIAKLASFNPRQYCVKNLSDRASALIYATILDVKTNEDA